MRDVDLTGRDGAVRFAIATLHTIVVNQHGLWEGREKVTYTALKRLEDEFPQCVHGEA